MPVRLKADLVVPIGIFLAALVTPSAAIDADRSSVTAAVVAEELGLVDLRVQMAADRLRIQGFALDGSRAIVAMWPDGPGRWAGRGLGVALDRGLQVSVDGGPWREVAVEVQPPIGPVPAWATGTTWYQIMPERFRNGNPANDPARHDTYRMPWNDAWFDVTLAEVESAWAIAAAGGRQVYPNLPGGIRGSIVWNRRLGGDLQGVVEKLDYLEDLGVQALYFTPVFESASLHKYDATDFRHVDPTLAHPGTPGPLPEAQRYEAELSDPVEPSYWRWTAADRYLLNVLLPESRARGMRVVLDGVWNHVGMEHFAFEDVVANGRSSRFAEWFEASFDADGQLTGWQGWNQWNGSLPEFARSHDGDGLHPEVERHVFDVTTRWMDPNGDGDPSDGIDGWRLDVAAEVPMGFWRRWREHVKAINPDALLIGEIWFPADDFLRGDQFDSQMNYPFAMAVTAWLGRVPDSTSQELVQRLADVLERQRPEVNLVQMNLVTSHDVERIAVMLANPGRGYDQDARVAGRESAFKFGPPPERAHRLAEIALAIQVCYLGAPMVYAGDELGMAGADDPDNRQPLPWPDLGPYAEGEGGRPETLPRWREWLRLRLDPQLEPVLRYGAVRFVDTGDPAVFAFERRLDQQVFLFVANRADEPFDASELLAELDAENSGWIPEVPAVSASWWLGKASE